MNDLMDTGADTHRIKDLGLAAALVTDGFEVQQTEKELKSVYFLFNKSQELDNAISDYWSNKLIVPARSYFDNTKMLKNRIYNGWPS